MSTEGIGVGFTGLGLHLPDRIRTNDEWPREWYDKHAERLRRDITGSLEDAARAKRRDIDPEVAAAIGPHATDPFRGAKERRVLAEDLESADMEAAACTAALESAGLAPEDVDCLVVYSMVPDSPGTDNQGPISKRLGLRPDILAFSVGAACSSFLPQLTVATRLVQAGDVDTALIVVSSAMSKVTDYTLPSSVMSGDGSVAAVIQRIEPGLGFIQQESFLYAELSGGLRLASAAEPEIPWYRTDCFDSRMLVRNVDRSKTHRIGAKAASLCRTVCERVMKKAGVTIDDVDYLAMAQSTAWFPEALGNALGVPPEKRLPADLHFEKYGHLLCASLPLNVYLSWQSGRLSPGDLVLMYTPGVGFHTSATLYRWNLAPVAP